MIIENTPSQQEVMIEEAVYQSDLYGSASTDSAVVNRPPLRTKVGSGARPYTPD